MHLIVTRPEADASELTGRLLSMGHTVSLAPLLEIHLEPANLDFANVQAVIATSRNALRAMAASPILDRAKDLTIFVVGKASAALALDLGFNRAVAGAGGAQDLLPLIRAKLRPEHGVLLYLSGEDIAFDLPAELRAAGYEVRRQVVYRAVAAESLPAQVADDIGSGTVSGVILMSPQTARLFAKLAEAAGLGQEARRLVHFCLSPAIAAALGQPAPSRVAIASKPSSEEMLALVKELASN